MNETPGQLHFHFRDLVEEIRILRDISRPFIASSSTGALPQLAEDLEGIWMADPTRDLRWELADLWTTDSKGEYERGEREGGRPIRACVSGTWQVKPLGPIGKKPKEKHKRCLMFTGIASTRVRIYYADNPDPPIAMWRMELGDTDSPGCYFHVQVLGEEEVPPFPKTVPVPRFPTLFITPMGVIEYVLGEIFQNRWARTAMEDGNARRWASLQKERLTQLLDWQQHTIKNTLTSPWVALKEAKPSATMFLKQR